jgi:pimeloyl-ACP methyl ester carboxylesterase
VILAHEVAGSGPARTAGWGPALLLVHAGIADRRMWDEQMGPFTDAGWTVIRANLPGFGETAPPALFELWDQSEGAIERGDHQEAARVEIDTWVVGVGRDPSTVDPEVRRRVRDMLLVAYEHGEAELEEPDPPAAGRLGEVAVPALVVVGEHDRPDIHAMAGALAAGIPRAERAVLPGTAHLPSMERPEACNQVVLEFLAKLGPGA